MDPITQRDITRVVIDECLRATSEVLDEVARRIGGRPEEVLVLGEELPGVPDLIILEKLMDARSLLVTRDCVLHSQAIDRGYTSLLQTPDKGWTEGRIIRVPFPAKYPTNAPPALESYLPPEFSAEAVAIAGILNEFRSERERKHFRTKRRRIRAYFGTAGNIGAVALTIAQRSTRRGVVGGYKLKVDSRYGTKGLFPASEGYFVDAASGDHPLLATVWALGHLYGLHLQGFPLTLYHLHGPTGERCFALMGTPTSTTDPIEQMAVRLLAEAARATFLPCAKGRFYDQMTEKLAQVTELNGNELVPVDLQAVATALLAPADASYASTVPSAAPQL